MVGVLQEALLLSNRLYQVHDLLGGANSLPSAGFMGCSDEKACGINSAKANVRQISNAIHLH